MKQGRRVESRFRVTPSDPVAAADPFDVSVDPPNYSHQTGATLDKFCQENGEACDSIPLTPLSLHLSRSLCTGAIDIPAAFLYVQNRALGSCQICNYRY